MTFAGQDGARLGGEVFHAKSKLIHADHTFCSGGQDHTGRRCCFTLCNLWFLGLEKSSLPLNYGLDKTFSRCTNHASRQTHH